MTIYEIARITGVSTASVSRVINQQSGVSEATREKILAVIQQSGYTPNLIARDLSTKNSLTVGLVLPGINSYFSPAVQALSQGLGDRGIHLLITTNPGGVFDPASEARNLRLLLAKRVSGVILFLNQLTDIHKQVLEKWPREVALVTVNDHWPGKDFSRVFQDPYPGYRALVEHLVQKGRRRVAFISGPQGDSTSDQRLQALREITQELGIPLSDSLVVPGQFDLVSGRLGIQTLLTRGPFDAVVCANDFMAVGALDALRSAGKKIPQEISVAGYDNVEISTYTHPSLTTVAQDVAALGQEALELLLEKLDDPQARCKQISLGSRLIIREST